MLEAKENKNFIASSKNKDNLDNDVQSDQNTIPNSMDDVGLNAQRSRSSGKPLFL